MNDPLKKILLEEMTLRQLRLIASEYEVSRYSRIRKVELIKAIREAQAAGKSENRADQVVTATSEHPLSRLELATVDDGFGDLPGGYGESRIVLMSRGPEWAYTYWDIPGAYKEEMRRQGAVRLALRFYDVTDIDINSVAPHSVQQYECDEMMSGSCQYLSAIATIS